MKFGDRTFNTMRVSDLIRDGMSLEIYETTTGPEVMVGEVFYSDETNDMTVSFYAENLPFELLEFMDREARERLVAVGEMVGGNQ